MATAKKTTAKKSTAAKKKAATTKTKDVARKTTSKQAKKATQTRAHKKRAQVRCTGACACKQAAAPGESFWVNNGPVVATIGELRVALESMSAAQYKYHTRGENDFACWVRDCFGAESLAKQLEKASSKTRAAAALASCCAK